MLRLITAQDFEIDTFARLVIGRLRTDPGYTAIQAIPGSGGMWAGRLGDRSRTGGQLLVARHSGSLVRQQG